MSQGYTLLGPELPQAPRDLATSRCTRCRSCRGNLIEVISFGHQPIAQAFVYAEEETDLFTYELTAAVCSACTLFQLMEVPTPDVLFHADYPFRTRTSLVAKRHFAQWASQIKNDLQGKPAALVVEIGSNDGTLLSNFLGGPVVAVGVEPAKVAASLARDDGCEVVQAFFDIQTSFDIRSRYGAADRIIGANVVAHIPDIAGLSEAVLALMKNDGLFVFEAVYLLDVIRNRAFDQIYDEHVFTFSVHSVMRTFASLGLELVQVARQPLQGGSMRYTLSKPGVYPVDKSVADALALEAQFGLDGREAYRLFREDCEQIRTDLRSVLERLVKERHRVAGYAASAKSTTVLNYCGIDSTLIYGIYDNTPEKQGRLTPGSRIPILPSSRFSAEATGHTLLLACNHRDEIEAKEQAYRKRGGRWILYRITRRIPRPIDPSGRT